jgi:hypothetical protein
MLLKQEKRHETRNTFATNSKSKFTLVFVVKTSTCILIFLEIKDAGLKELVKTHKGRYNILDDKLSGVIDCGLTATDRQTETHTVTSLHEFDDVALRHGANSHHLDNILVFVTNCGSIKILAKRVKL